jgi:hypothetical protein
LAYLTTHTSLSPIRRGVAPGFVNYKKRYSRLTAASDEVYQLLAHGRWFSPGTRLLPPLKLVAMILLKVTLNAKKQTKTIICKQTQKTGGKDELNIVLMPKS